MRDADKDMERFETYRDLKLRWKRTTKSRKNRVRLARKWRQPRYVNPASPPTCMFVLHERLPQTRNVRGYGPRPPWQSDTHAAAEGALTRPYSPGEITLDESHNFQVSPPPEVVQQLRDGSAETFCVFKSSALHQHKVTKGDLVQIERLRRRSAGDKVTFGTVLLVGSRDWTIIGKPTVPYAKVEATIEQQTLCGEQLSFRYRKSRRISRFLRVRHWVTVLRIDNIVVDPEMRVDRAPVKPLRLLDLWANRWLYEEELDGVKYADDRTAVVVEHLAEVVTEQQDVDFRLVGDLHGAGGNEEDPLRRALVSARFRAVIGKDVAVEGLVAALPTAIGTAVAVRARPGGGGGRRRLLLPAKQRMEVGRLLGSYALAALLPGALGAPLVQRAVVERVEDAVALEVVKRGLEPGELQASVCALPSRVPLVRVALLGPLEEGAAQTALELRDVGALDDLDAEHRQQVDPGQNRGQLLRHG
ncbi:mitochondrial ribosomal protein L21 precursor, putative [Babesia caballi]|uniref:Large ribosomal subunit protein bL21m n=1 Tax=Babesia caballi TaxID=5871 RepID=A0AAV4LMB1_BABCB|nr:mitochondrial ribosomal protein L21 precursor, putative [Babesia caballi]